MLDTADRILVTGADGFIGSHLVEMLLRHGCRVTAVVRRTSRTQVDKLCKNLDSSAVDALDNLIFVDLSGPDAVERLASAGADVWFHLAADAYVPASFEQPRSVVTTNVVSTLSVLEAARQALPKRLIITSSSEVYGNHSEPIAEDFSFLPSTPYAASKVAVDRLAFAYRESFDLPVTIVRPFNCYGPRHIYDVIPIFIRNALDGNPLVVNGDGMQTRDLTYVSDTVDGFIAIASCEARTDSVNIATGVGTSVLDLAQTIVEMTGSTSSIQHGARRIGEVENLIGDSTQLQAITSWKPLISLEQGLARNIDWFRNRLGLL